MPWSLKEALERRDRDRNESGDRSPSGLPADLVLWAPGEIEQPVSLVRALVSFSLDLREAHDAVDRLACGESVRVTLSTTAESESLPSLRAFGVMANVLAGEATA
ncbi:hypothetical protein SAMN05192568_1019119 [Methylobacterium pseudosasicola]|uniref:Uncharacterized protein n=1 Tax=Methylobacterium pseudosasicola TaxID=582667 RepID=A0A1I4N6Y3_9HYPH|nr:hypothetical protein SAMN05192568_1019119 [Methylobacterium pseudosasicola]